MSENQFTCRRCGSRVSIDDFPWNDFNLFDIQKKRRLCHDCIEEGRALCMCGHEADDHKNRTGYCRAVRLRPETNLQYMCGCHEFSKIVQEPRVPPDLKVTE